MKALIDLASVICEMDPDLRLTSRPAKREVGRLLVDIGDTCTCIVRNNPAMRNPMDFMVLLTVFTLVLVALGRILGVPATAASQSTSPPSVRLSSTYWAAAVHRLLVNLTCH
ncbi:hypothetical protein B0H65DRAFT_455140 [Neurospora tetraspora]|uniref:Uncharacterized protein n=1 Tax=Neurospora tetraspora TaxID=94610 RepID=A0AAE0MTN7_9PEZI|nr:hypothetical protein B0H65DRAFT_455140 [Neurospora tetraspora]